MTSGQHKLCGYHILPHWADIIPRYDSRPDPDRLGVARVLCRAVVLGQRFDIFNWDDRVRPTRKGIARIDIYRQVTSTQANGVCRRGTFGVFRADGKAVHSGRVIMRAMRFSPIMAPPGPCLERLRKAGSFLYQEYRPDLLAQAHRPAWIGLVLRGCLQDKWT